MNDQTDSFDGEEEPITLPFRWQKSLIPDAVREILSSVCVPFDRAQAGDIVAIPMDVSYYDSVRVFPIVQALVKTAQGTTQLVRYPDLPDAQRPVFADAVMRLNGANTELAQMAAHLEKMSSGDGETEYFTVLYTPRALFVHFENYMDEIFEGRYFGEDPAQDQFDEAMIMLADPDGTGHERLAILAALPSLAQMFIASAPVEDTQSGEDVVIALPAFTPFEDNPA
jgi:hypothetical protein